MEKKILVVDDNKSILSIVKHWLFKEGYEVDVTEHPRQALDLACQTPYDLIILDIMMDEMNGFEVLDGLRAEEKTRNARVMIFTAQSLYRNIIPAAKEKFDDFLTKPFEKDELLEKVRNAVMASPACSQAGR